MKNIFIAMLILVPFFGTSQSYDIKTSDAHVEFYFVSKEVHGTMTGVNAQVLVDFENLKGSKVVGSAMVSSLSTKNEGRDHHLMADDMFDAEKFPLMKFESELTSVSKDGDQVSGTLTIRDVSKKVVFDLSNVEGTLVFKTEINSSDFGVPIKKNYEDNMVEVYVYVPIK